jgi:ferredoxin
VNYKEQEEKLRSQATELLNGGQVDVVLGLKENPDAGHPTPVFVRDAADVEQLVWNENCYMNLSVYLLDLKGKKVAIAAKPKDKRSVINLIAERQIQKENVVILDMEWEEEEQKEQRVTDWMSETSLQDRFARFQKEISKCTLCFACRQACPNCYCESCYLDRKATPWNLTDVDQSTKITYHLTRAMHLAGRCTDCGGCKDACDFGVDLHYLMQGLREFVSDEYDFRAGEDPDAVSAMNDYGPNDVEIGFLGGETV